MRSSTVLLSVLLSGCVSYRELGTATPARGAEVVARLSQPLAIPLQDVTVREVNVAAGRVTYADADSLVVAVQRFTSIAGADYPGLGTQVTIGRDRIATLQQRKVAPARTALLLGVGTAALVAIVTSVRSLFGGPGGGTEPPPQP
jgi:hypothetical protein